MPTPYGDHILEESDKYFLENALPDECDECGNRLDECTCLSKYAITE